MGKTTENGKGQVYLRHCCGQYKAPAECCDHTQFKPVLTKVKGIINTE